MIIADDRLAGRILASASDFAIISLDRDRKVTSWNPGAEKLLGWSASEIMGQSADVIFVPEDQEAGAPADEMQVSLSVGTAIDERWHMRRDGTRFWGSGLMMPLIDEAGETDGFVKIMRDRTAERAAEQRYNALTATLPGFLLVADTNGHIIETNQVFRNFTGRDAAGLHGDRWLETVHPDDAAGLAAQWTGAISRGEPFHARLRFRGRDNDYRCYACRAEPERDEEGRIIRWMGTCLDVEDEARARAALERLTLTLEQRVVKGSEDLASAIDSLQSEVSDRIRAEEALRQAQKVEAIGQITGGVAHDFNNLLTVIRGSAELLGRPDLSSERRERYRKAIIETADRGATMTAQLLAFARRQSLEPVVFDVAKQLDMLEHLLATTLGPRVDLVIEVRCTSCTVLADSNQFDTALLNMAVNARDAMEGVGRLIISADVSEGIPPVRRHAARPGRFVTIAVSDTGPGIPPERIDRVFEPFYTTKPVGRGTGLGLSQVHGFAKQSGGEIEVGSGDEGGSRFTLYLPHAEAGTPVTEEAESSSASQQVEYRGNILVVEDNEAVGQFATELLKELGYSATWVKDAAAALDIMAWQSERFDAVFSDVVMPGMSGIELARRLREERPALPVVLATGYSDALAENGTNDFEVLQKPYSAARLAEALKRALPSD
ncbi:hypothetical protein GCM10007276_33840 [Agaricicola taiwanensis]|uniref:histidine kinase n=1 Tax=Agaricicola taiwanensis TaxID=591372 RepID=A0A8J3DYT1_9RHOB|nr:PAS domain-containing sensor histidine kinase [Agaricicola taiwanensis]GGE53959.1 hypothetical protein GCM10007276_33840 [Agaricicola taiwanensis]